MDRLNVEHAQNYSRHYGSRQHSNQKTTDMKKIAARVLATYLIPGCVGRGVRLGSESLSGAGGAGIWKFGDLGTWKSGNLEIWRSGDLEIWEFGIQKILNIIFEINILVAQNVGNFLISRNKSS